MQERPHTHIYIHIYVYRETERFDDESIGDIVGFGGLSIISPIFGGFLDNGLFIYGYLFYFDLAFFCHLSIENHGHDKSKMDKNKFTCNVGSH